MSILFQGRAEGNSRHQLIARTTELDMFSSRCPPTLGKGLEERKGKNLPSSLEFNQREAHRTDLYKQPRTKEMVGQETEGPMRPGEHIFRSPLDLAAISRNYSNKEKFS